MGDWTAGYVSEIGYTYGYYSELNPLRIKLAFLNKGIHFPEVKTACELGFGQGVSLNLHAAASVTRWYGTDFNPTQAGFAQSLAESSGCEAKLYDESFEEFSQRSDLPEFDYIAMHGIWSWISDENRNVIVDFIRRKLKVGGVLYISYNTMPGWSQFAPMRHLMVEHSEKMGAPGNGIISRLNGAVEFIENLMATDPLYARANPLTAERIKKLKEQNSQYLAHEYLNYHWHPMHFSKVVEWLHPAKLNFACSAHYLEHIDGINLTAEQLNFLNAIPDTLFRESVRDYMVNQQFRRDYWVKGDRRMSSHEQIELLREQRVVLQTYRPAIKLTVSGSRGEAQMSSNIYDPILDYLGDHKIRTVAQIEDHIIKKGLQFSQLVEALIILSGMGHIAPAQDDDQIEKAKVQTDKLNTRLCKSAIGSDDVSQLASPVTGGGITVNRIQRLFLLEMKTGNQDIKRLATAAWNVLNHQNQKLVKDGKILESEQENIAELQARAEEFLSKLVPILKSLQVI